MGSAWAGGLSLRHCLWHRKRSNAVTDAASDGWRRAAARADAGLMRPSLPTGSRASPISKPNGSSCSRALNLRLRPVTVMISMSAAHLSSFPRGWRLNRRHAALLQRRRRVPVLPQESEWSSSPLRQARLSQCGSAGGVFGIYIWVVHSRPRSHRTVTTG